MRVDRLVRTAAGVQFEKFRWNAQHRPARRNREFRIAVDAVQRDADLAAARYGAVGDQDEIEQQLDVVLGQQPARSVPFEFRLLVSEEGGCDGLRVARIDHHSRRTGGAEGDSGELQPGRGISGAGAYQLHGVFIGAAFVQQLEPVVDGAYRRDDVVAYPAAQKGSEIGCGERENVGHRKYSIPGDHRLAGQAAIALPASPNRINCLPPGGLYGSRTSRQIRPAQQIRGFAHTSPAWLFVWPQVCAGNRGKLLRCLPGAARLGTSVNEVGHEPVFDPPPSCESLMVEKGLRRRLSW